MPLHHIEDSEFNGTRSTIIGTAIYDIDTAHFYDSDIGGFDGPCVTSCELLRVELDNIHLNRAQIADLIGKHNLEASEELVAEEYQTEIREFGVAAE